VKTATPPSPQKSRPGPLSTRGGTFLVAALFALLAGAALLLFLRQYREDLTDSDPVRVLVARSLVPKGTPGDIVASERLYKIVRVPEADREELAMTDPSDLRDRVATGDIDPGHQLVEADFEDAGDRVGNRLTGYERAMTVPVGPAHGMIGKIEEGDRVDVVVTSEGDMGGLATARMAARNVLVLDVPGKADGGDEQPATIRVSDEEAVGIAAGADGGEVWLVLRPAIRARSHNSARVVANALRGGGTVKADINIDVDGAEEQP
jgi:Flp pilus assembly protein CpaB